MRAYPLISIFGFLVFEKIIWLTFLVGYLLDVKNPTYFDRQFFKEGSARTQADRAWDEHHFFPFFFFFFQTVCSVFQ